MLQQLQLHWDFGWLKGIWAPNSRRWSGWILHNLLIYGQVIWGIEYGLGEQTLVAILRLFTIWSRFYGVPCGKHISTVGSLYVLSSKQPSANPDVAIQWSELPKFAPASQSDSVPIHLSGDSEVRGFQGARASRKPLQPISGRFPYVPMPWKIAWRLQTSELFNSFHISTVLVPVLSMFVFPNRKVESVQHVYFPLN